MNLYESMNKYFEKSFDLKEEDKQEPIKEARGSYKLAVQKALLDADLQLPDASPMNKKVQEEAVAKAIDAIKAAKAKTDDEKELKAYNRALMILEHRPTPIAFNSLGAWYSGISMSESRRPKEGCKLSYRMKESKDHDKPEYYRIIKKLMNGDDEAAEIAYDFYENNDIFEDYDDVEEFEDFATENIRGLLDPDAGFEKEERAIIRRALNKNRKSVKEDLGTDIERYQKYVDYDMKHYGRISNKTKSFIDEAGLQVIKDQYGDYEVTAGHYIEDCRRNRKMKESKHNYFSRKPLRESHRVSKNNIKRPTSKKKLSEALKTQKKLVEKKKDLWDTIYGELTEDGSQYIAPETGKPRINKGAGYKFDDQIAVDRAGNIVVKVKEERDLKAAIDIADSHKDEGVTYNISESKYDKKYPYWMTIEIPQEDLKEGKLTEKRWRYQVSDKVSKEFRDAVNADDEDYERVRNAIITVYDDIHDNSNLLDDDDYEDWVTEGVAVEDFDTEDDVNYELSNLYDFCDNASIWIGI